MTTRHQVTCITPDGADADQRIDAIGGSSGGNGPNGSWRLAIDEAIARIDDRTYEFWTRVDGRVADIVVAQRANGRRYLKTTADGHEPNNLLSLPTCP